MVFKDRIHAARLLAQKLSPYKGKNALILAIPRGAVCEKKPKTLVAATAVAPYESLEKIRPLCDAVVCLDVPADFYAVGQFFEVFDQVSDDAVVDMLRKNRS